MIDFITAENAVTGSILIDGSCLALVCNMLDVDDFSIESNRAIFKAACDLDKNGLKIDAVTIENILIETNETVPRNYLIQLMEITPTAANVEEYAKMVRETSQRRRLHAIGESIAERAMKIEKPSEIICDAVREFEHLEQLNSNDLVSSKDAVFSFYRYRDSLETGAGIVVSTGIVELDNILGGGMLNSGLYLMAARPGVGKTTLSLTFADDIAERVGPVLFVSLEMSVEQLMAKRLSRFTGIPSTELLTKKFSNKDNYSAVAKAGDHICHIPLYLNRRARCTVSDIRFLARRIKGLKLIVVDYLGLLQSDGKTVNRYEMVTKISGELKSLARILNVPILALCQLNRANEARADKHPTLADLRDSGSLEQDADGVILLHRPDYYDDEIEGSSRVEIELNIAKNRHGSVGKMMLMFDKQTSKFIEIVR